jgi:hypothetical protein
MDQAGALDDDPAALLEDTEIAWAAAHLASCDACAPDAAALAVLASALRDDADAPDEAFFAAQRSALMENIRATDVGALDRRTAHTPVLAGTRPALRAVPRPADRRVPGAPRRSVWSAWGPVVPALAAGLVLIVGLGVMRARAPQPAREVAVAEVAEPRGGDLLAKIDAAAGDDTWVVADEDLFAVALASPSEPAIDELSKDDFSEAELEQVEGVFVPMPGWS